MTSEQIEKLRQEYEEASSEVLGLSEDYQDAQFEGRLSESVDILNRLKEQEALAMELGKRLREFDPSVEAWWDYPVRPTLTLNDLPVYRII
jgi:hypothetical protein